MKKIIVLFFAPFVYLSLAFAQENHHAHHHAAATSDFTVTAHTQNPLTENTPEKVTLFLMDKNNQGVGLDALETVHTEKVHALIVDPTLTDYQHVHPVAGKNTGEYVFDFTPHTANNYRIWLDITPVNGQQSYVMTTLPGKNKQNPPVVKTVTLQSTVGDYQFSLSFNKPLKAGQEVTGSVKVTDKNGKPVTQLEPIMEAFAHIVAFNEDFRTVLHAHPLGAKPIGAAARGGPRIDFHLTPTATGFVKIFVQLKINGKELFVPFGVDVKE